MTFLVFLTIFTKVGMKINTEDVAQNILFIVSIFLGSMIFWLLISNLINKSKRNFKIETFYRINKVIGTVITIFGVYSVTLGIFKI
jgi:LysE type translocator.